MYLFLKIAPFDSVKCSVAKRNAWHFKCYASERDIENPAFDWLLYRLVVCAQRPLLDACMQELSAYGVRVGQVPGQVLTRSVLDP